MRLHVPPPADGLQRPGQADFSEAGASQPSSEFEFATFNAVSSFNLPGSCDSSLLTPVSSSASPPMFPNTELAAQQHQQQHQQQQQPYPTPGRDSTPPRMYWPSEYSLGATQSQSCSPLSLHTTTSAPGGCTGCSSDGCSQDSAAGFDLYMAHGSASSSNDQCPQSPLPALQPSGAGSFFGSSSYGVVASIEDGSETMTGLQDYYVPVRDVNPSSLVMREHQQTPTRRLSPPSSSSSASSASSFLRKGSSGHQRRASAQDMSADMSSPSDVFAVPKGPADRNSGQRAYRIGKKHGAAGRARSRSEQLSRSVLKDITEVPADEMTPMPSATSSTSPATAAAAAAAAAAAIAAAAEVAGRDESSSGGSRPATESDMPLLKDDTPAEEKLLFQLRLKHDEMKGRAMWDAILQDYFEITGKHIEKAALQMKFFRAKSKWVIWTPNYLQALVEAFEEVERDRYKDICDRFRKKIGKNIVDFTPGNIETKLVEMGMEEDMYMETSAKPLIRRRKKMIERRRGSSAVNNHNNSSNHNNNNELAEDGRRPSSYEAGAGLDEMHSVSSLNTFTEEQADDVLDQVERRGFGSMHLDTPSPPSSSPIHDGAYAAAAASAAAGSLDDDETMSLRGCGGDAGPSEKVARQACEDIIGSASPFHHDHSFYSHQDLAVLS